MTVGGVDGAKRMSEVSKIDANIRRCGDLEYNDVEGKRNLTVLTAISSTSMPQTIMIDIAFHHFITSSFHHLFSLGLHYYCGDRLG